MLCYFGLVTVAMLEIDISSKSKYSVVLVSVLHVYMEDSWLELKYNEKMKTGLQHRLCLLFNTDVVTNSLIRENMVKK